MDKFDWDISIREVLSDGSYGTELICDDFGRTRAWGYADRTLTYGLRAVCVHCNEKLSSCKCQRWKAIDAYQKDHEDLCSMQAEPIYKLLSGIWTYIALM